MMKLSNGLRKLRDARGLGVTALARQVGISRQTVYAIEAGRYLPNTKIALTMAQALDVAVEELFSIHPQKTKFSKGEPGSIHPEAGQMA
jgi:putative molybdopterin biosynthesis protein